MFEAKLANKSPPPVDPGEVDLGATGGDFELPKPPRPAKTSFESGDCSFGGGGEVWFEGKVNPLKASVRPFTLDWPAVLPIEDVRSCCVGAGCGFGAVAYSERIDCFRSGRESPVCEVDVGAVLPGRLAGVDWLLPKKSKPSNESAGFVCFAAAAGCAELGGGGGRATAVGPVVLGRAGGLIASSSPKKSTDG